MSSGSVNVRTVISDGRAVSRTSTAASAHRPRRQQPVAGRDIGRPEQQQSIRARRWAAGPAVRRRYSRQAQGICGTRNVCNSPTAAPRQRPLSCRRAPVYRCFARPSASAAILPRLSVPFAPHPESSPSRPTTDLEEKFVAPQSRRSTFRFSGGAPAPSAATGC